MQTLGAGQVAPNSTATHIQSMWYRLTFDITSDANFVAASNTLLHFGAIDWQSSVYMNGMLLGNHTGGYLCEGH